MPVSVTLPELGESVTEGTVTRWLKAVGDAVAVDEPLLEVSTDKVDTEIPSPAAGTLTEIKVAEDETVAVGAELALISEGADGAGDDPEPSATADASTAGAAPTETAAPAVTAAPAEADESPEVEPAAAAETKASPTDDPPSAPGDRAGAASGRGPVTGDADTPVLLPELGESVTEGTVTRWLKAVGDSVEVDEPLVEVSTDKVDTEIPSPVAGTLVEISAAEDQTIPVGGQLALIGTGAPAAAATEPAPTEAAGTASDPGTAAPVTSRADTPEPGAAAPADPAVTPTPTPAAAGTGSSTAASPSSPLSAGPAIGADAAAYVTPLVRRLAAESKVDLAGLTGSGVGGRIRKQDVLDAAQAAAKAQADAALAAAPDPAPRGEPPQTPSSSAPTVLPVSTLRGTTEKMSRMRRVIASRMVESLQVSAQLTSVIEVDVTAIATLRQRAKAGFERREGVKLSFLPFFALAAVEALKAYPKLNATIDTDAGEIHYQPAENLGVAVDTERGLMVPVIRDAGDLNLAGIARRISDLAARTRTNAIKPDELSGGSFTLTNTGSRGALFDTPILNQPQVGILGTGAVVKRPVVLDVAGIGETIAVRSMVYLALTYDHRLVDGADAARFLVVIKNRLEEGAFAAEVGL